MREYPEGYWWVSFADRDRFRGVAIVRLAGTIEDVVHHTIQAGCNAGPDTFVQAQWISLETTDEALKAAPRDRLMFEDELTEHRLCRVISGGRDEG
jgi:hypothetical protein